MDSWEVLCRLKYEIITKINKIIIFGENGTEVIFSTRAGNLYGFGNNSFGELGLGHKNAIKEPQNIIELNDKQIDDFTFGLKHILAKTITGKLYSWGDNSYGQLGVGTYETDFRPKLINSLSDKFVIAMSCGRNHTLVLTDDHQIYSFGYNIDGQIGYGNTTKPTKIIGFNNENIISISCGGWHSLALTQTGNVYSWGHNYYGQLGTGDHTNTNIPRKLIVSNTLTFKGIVCGNHHSLLLSQSGDLYGFGYNGYGNVGTGDTNHISLPKNIPEIKGVKEISATILRSISMAILEDNTCLVWGRCLTGNILKPKQTQFTSFNEVIENYSEIKITVKTSECHIRRINRSWDKVIESFDNENLSDILFKVGNNKIFVNRLILKLKSNYFKNKYFSKSNEIRETSTESFDAIEYIEVINNYCYEVFYSYLKYIYTDCVEIENQYLDQLLILSIDYEEEELIITCTEKIFNTNLITFEKILNLLIYSMDKNVNELKVKCIDRIKSMKTIENVCNVYEVSIKYGLNELENNCLYFIKGLKERKVIFNTDSYINLSNDMKVKIFEKLTD